MLRSRTLLLFLLKAVMIYGFLSLPLSFCEEAYSNFYNKVSGVFFSEFNETGFVQFGKSDDPTMAVWHIGNRILISPDGTPPTIETIINTRFMGYIPTILLIALVLASPVHWRRRLIALAAGLILVTFLILFRQWIDLLWNCANYPVLQLTNFSNTSIKLLIFTHRFIFESLNTVPIIVVAIWLLVTFRLEDFRTIPQSSGKKRSTLFRH